MPTELDAAYLAGFVDGEGHIGISLLSTASGTKRHTLVVVVVNTDQEGLERLQSTWGGDLRLRTGKRPRQYKPVYVLRWNTAEAKAVLAATRPHMLIKAEQAAIALRFAETLRPHGQPGGTVPLTQEEWEYRESLRVELRKLTARGSGEPAEVEQLAFPEKPPLDCQYCGETFTTYQKRRKYCSQECAMKAGRDAWAERQMTERACPICAEVFMARHNQKLCSPKCSVKMQWRKGQLGPRKAATGKET